MADVKVEVDQDPAAVEVNVDPEEREEGQLDQQEAEEEVQLHEEPEEAQLNDKPEEGQLDDKREEGQLHDKPEGQLDDKPDEGQLDEEPKEDQLEERKEGQLNEEPEEGQLDKKPEEGELDKKLEEGQLDTKPEEGELGEELLEGQLDEEPNAAATNPLILKTIFDSLSLPELKICRTMARAWCNLTYPNFQNQAWVTLAHEKGNSSDLTKFLSFVSETYSTPGDVVFKKYQLKFQKLTDAYMAKPKSRISEFLMAVGPSIESLYLNKCKIDKGSLDRFIASGQFPKLVNLILEECLFMFTEVEEEDEGAVVVPAAAVNIPVNYTNNIRQLTFHSDYSQFAEPFELRNFWRMFPNLMDLGLAFLTTNQTLDILDSAAEHRRVTGQPVKLTKLRNMFANTKYSIRKVPEILIQSLCNTGFPLTLLEIDIGENIQEWEFEQLIRSFAGTMETLLIWRGLLAYKIQGFPYAISLPRLRHLRIPENCLKDMAFVKYTRSLISLTIIQCDRRPSAYPADIFLNKAELDEGGAHELIPLPRTRIFTIEYGVTDEDIEFVRRIFPGLVKLSAFVENDFVTREY